MFRTGLVSVLTVILAGVCSGFLHAQEIVSQPIVQYPVIARSPAPEPEGAQAGATKQSPTVLPAERDEMLSGFLEKHSPYLIDSYDSLSHSSLWDLALTADKESGWVGGSLECLAYTSIFFGGGYQEDVGEDRHGVGSFGVNSGFPLGEVPGILGPGSVGFQAGGNVTVGRGEHEWALTGGPFGRFLDLYFLTADVGILVDYTRTPRDANLWQGRWILETGLWKDGVLALQGSVPLEREETVRRSAEGDLVQRSYWHASAGWRQYWTNRFSTELAAGFGDGSEDATGGGGTLAAALGRGFSLQATAQTSFNAKQNYVGMNLAYDFGGSKSVKPGAYTPFPSANGSTLRTETILRMAHPSIFSFSPNSGGSNIPVTLLGEGFQEGVRVVFTNLPGQPEATIESFAPDMLVFRTPAAGAGSTSFIEVRNPDGSVARSATFYTYT